MFKLLEKGAEDAVGGGGALFDSVVAVLNDVGLNDGDNAGELTFFGKTSQKVGIFFDSDKTRLVFANMELGAPFGEAITFGESSAKAVE